jgi:hypothetical protein
MSTLEPAPAAAVLPQRALRVVALALLSVVVTPILVIFAIGIDSRVIGKVLGLFDDRNPSEQVALYSLVPLLLLIAAGIFFGLWKLLARSWTRIAAGFAAFALLFVYLAHDESTFRHPMTMENISPVFPGEDASYNLLMRYGKQHPLGQGFQAPTFKNPYPKLVLSPASEWRGTITSRREELEAHWTQLATERAWWNELSQFDKIGDLMPGRRDGEIPSFAIFRTMSQHSVAIASLQALDGHGDQAIDTLLPTLEVGRKLSPYSRSLVRVMIAVVIEKMAIQTANFILDTTPVSPEARARLAAALKGGDPEAGARHLMYTEYAVHFGWMPQTRVGDIVSIWLSDGSNRHLWVSYFNCFSSLFYLPHATLNRMGDLYEDWGELAAQRKVGQMAARWEVFQNEMSGPGLKNPMGRYMALMAIPAYEKVAQNYWSKEDMRAALLERLAKP